MKGITVLAVADSAASGMWLKDAAATVSDSAVLIEAWTDDSFASLATAIVDQALEIRPELILTATTKNGRLAAGMIAAKLGATVLTDLKEMHIDESGVTGTRMVYGGAAFKTERVPFPAVLCVSESVIESAPAGAVRVLNINKADARVRLLDKKVKETATVDLSAAKRVVAIGRGVPGQEEFRLLRTLGDMLEAELGCTRPVAEEYGWMPKESYIGVSGVMLKPELYLAAGVSGQVQHMVGATDAKLIFAINKDRDAPIFSQCDYGLVADISAVLPALIEGLR